jgi:hypothetical protein
VARLKNPGAVSFGNFNQNSPRAGWTFLKGILWMFLALILDRFHRRNFYSLVAVQAGWGAKRAKRGVAAELSTSVLGCIQPSRITKRTYSVF